MYKLVETPSLTIGELVSSLPILASSCQHSKACPNMPRLGEKGTVTLENPWKPYVWLVYLHVWISPQLNHWKSPKTVVFSVASAPMFNPSLHPAGSKLLGSLTARALIASRRPKLFRVCWTNPPEWLSGAATDPCKIVLIFSCLVDLSYVYGCIWYMATYGNKNQTTHLRLTKIGPRNGAKYLDDSQVAEQLNQWELIGIENTYSRVVW